MARRSSKRKQSTHGWLREDFLFLEVGEEVDKTAIDVNEDNVKAGDNYVRNIFQTRLKQRYSKTDPFAYWMKTVGVAEAFTIFEKNTSKSRLADIGAYVKQHKPFDINDFLRLPSVTNAELKNPAIYASAPVRPQFYCGHYAGSGNNKSARRLGLGARLNDYDRAKRYADTVPTNNRRRASRSRHLRAALVADTKWPFRTFSTFAPGTPNCNIILLEGLWVDLLCILYPHPTVLSFCNADCVAAYKETLLLGQLPPIYEPLDGAHPFAQGSCGYRPSTRGLCCKVVVN